MRNKHLPYSCGPLFPSLQGGELLPQELTPFQLWNALKDIRIRTWLSRSAIGGWPDQKSYGFKGYSKTRGYQFVLHWRQSPSVSSPHLVVWMCPSIQRPLTGGRIKQIHGSQGPRYSQEALFNLGTTLATTATCSQIQVELNVGKKLLRLS